MQYKGFPVILLLLLVLLLLTGLPGPESDWHIGERVLLHGSEGFCEDFL